MKKQKSLYLFTWAVLTFAATPQSLQIDGQLETEVTSTVGNFMNVPDLPKPEWRNEAGSAVAHLRFEASDAAAWRLTFRSMSLPPGAKMMLLGVDATGKLRAAHGPYEGHGPLNLPEFQTRLIEGAAVVVEVRGGDKNSDRWPFTLQSVERSTPEQLVSLKERGIQLEPTYQPAKRQSGSELRTAWLDGELVQYQVIDGLAVMEGDMFLGTVAEVEGGGRQSGKNNGRQYSHDDPTASKLWPNGRIPYTIEYSNWGILRQSDIEAKIFAAIVHWNQRLPGILIPRNGQLDYLTFKWRGGYCGSDVGRQSGQQFIVLENDCSLGAVIHEIGHVLGLRHEHTRPDRNNWVRVNWNKIQQNVHVLGQFQLLPAAESRSLGPYDYGSIMHYGLTDFAEIEGEATLTPLQPVPAGVTIGQRNALSAGDIAGIRARYCNAALYNMPGTFNVDSMGGSHSFTVIAPAHCTWSVSEQISWLSLTGSTTKTGVAAVTFTAFANGGSATRTGTMRIGGRSITIRQVSVNFE